MTTEDWQRVIDVDLTGVFFGAKYGARELIKEGGKGSIINISSAVGLIGFPTASPYNAAKGGVRLLTKSAALDMADAGYQIRVNSVHPGWIDTDIIKESIAPIATYSTTYGRKMGEPEDIAWVCVYLASDESKFATDDEFPVSGGLTTGVSIQTYVNYIKGLQN